jgi:hypothetical protein
VKRKSLAIFLLLGLLGMEMITCAADGRSAGAPPPDERASLGLSREAEAGLKLTMREHLEAIRDIIAALSRQEFETAARVAHEELGFQKHHQAMTREAGAAFPPKYQELALQHHREAEALADVLSSRDFSPILTQLGRTVAACVACHRAYRL